MVGNEYRYKRHEIFTAGRIRPHTLCSCTLTALAVRGVSGSGTTQCDIVNGFALACAAESFKLGYSNSIIELNFHKIPRNYSGVILSLIPHIVLYRYKVSCTETYSIMSVLNYWKRNSWWILLQSDTATLTLIDYFTIWSILLKLSEQNFTSCYLQVNCLK